MPSFPYDLFSYFRRGKGLEELEPLKDVDTYGRLRRALGSVSDMETLPPFGAKISRASQKKRLKKFLLASGFKPGLSSRLLGVWGDNSGRNKRMRSIKAAEARVALNFLESAGFSKYKSPTIAFADQPEILFHSFAKQSGSPNEGTVRKRFFREIYEMYSVDVGPVLAEQGRYNIYCGYVVMWSYEGDNVVHARFMQPNGATPDGSGFEEYSGFVFMEDDSVYVMGFKAEPDDEIDIGMEDMTAEPAVQENKTPKGQRRNLAMMVLNGFSRSADGLYDKMVGGQVGRGLTGATGVLSSPCVLYRVTDDRVRQLDEKVMSQAQDLYDDSYDEYRTRSSTRQPQPTFPGHGEIPWGQKARFFKEKIIGAKSIITGIELRDLGVMSDLNIPVPMRSDADDHVDINVFSGR